MGDLWLTCISHLEASRSEPASSPPGRVKVARRLPTVGHVPEAERPLPAGPVDPTVPLRARVGNDDLCWP